MPFDPLTVGLTLASVFGNERANRANAREAQKNRDFQEMMSSTAAQRSAADYAKAGFNPALAYDRPASGGGGAQATVGNPLEGISGALAMRNAKALVRQEEAKATSLEVDAEDKRIELGLKNTTVGDGRDVDYRAWKMAQRRNDLATYERATQMFPNQAASLASEVALKQAQAFMAQKQGVKASAEAEMYGSLGGLAPLIQLLAPVAFGGIGAATGIARTMAGKAVRSTATRQAASTAAKSSARAVRARATAPTTKPRRRS